MSNVARNARLLAAASGEYRYMDNAEFDAAVPNYTLDRKIAQARKEMGEERWAMLNKEWEQ